jgi:hypothetical protein
MATLNIALVRCNSWFCSGSSKLEHLLRELTHRTSRDDFRGPELKPGDEGPGVGCKAVVGGLEDLEARHIGNTVGADYELNDNLARCRASLVTRKATGN